jgi:hypothetical protein
MGQCNTAPDVIPNEKDDTPAGRSGTPRIEMIHEHLAGRNNGDSEDDE